MALTGLQGHTEKRKDFIKPLRIIDYLFLPLPITNNIANKINPVLQSHL